MKKILLTLAAAAAFATAGAQVTNRALQFETTGDVDCGPLPTLNNLTTYTVQFWVNPTQATEGASILSVGDSFGAKLGASNNVVFNSGTTTLSTANASIKSGEWSQVTLVVDNGTAKAFVNGTDTVYGNLQAIPETTSPLKLGGGYAGMIDEVRIYNAALPTLFESFVFNTLNKWAPLWDNLLVYYKMDETDCENLVDYHDLANPKTDYNNHGILSSGVSRVEANNTKMPYLWNAAYTENSRFFDRIIPRDQYLLSNAIIILGANCIPQTGGIYTRTPNNHALATPGAEYMESYQGRDGVISLNGKTGTYIECSDSTFKPTSAYTFETWIYLEEWTPGAYILRKENDAKTQGFALYLSENQGQLIVRVNGGTYASRPNNFNLPVGEWAHIAIVPGSDMSVAETMVFYLNGSMSRTLSNDPMTTGTKGGFTPSGNESLKAYIGENLNAKLDETCMWYKTWTTPDIVNQMNYIPLPSITRNVNVSDMAAVDAYYRYDNPDWLGFSSHSQDNWMLIMKSAFDGHQGYKFYLSVNGSDNNSPAWQTIINTAAKRKKFAQDLAALSDMYDGVELDMEWVYNASGWSNYALMADEIRAALPADKEFRISTHNVTYEYPVNKMDAVTGFTFQQYGPQPVNFQYSNFTSKVQAFINYGYPREKIVTSYSTTTSQGQPGGTAIRGFQNSTILDDYQINWQNVDTKVINGQTYSFDGPMQAFRRAKYTREQGLQGIFYWDMGNDNWKGTAAAPIMPEYNSAKFVSYAINANNDSIVNKVDVNHYDSSGIQAVSLKAEKDAELEVSPSPVHDTATVTIGGEAAKEVTVYSMGGAAVIKESDNIINMAGLQGGIYLVTALAPSGKVYRGKLIKD